MVILTVSCDVYLEPVQKMFSSLGHENQPREVVTPSSE